MSDDCNTVGAECLSCPKINKISECRQMRIVELTEENDRLRKTIIALNDRLSSAHSKINRAYHDSYDDCTHDRDER